MAVSLASVVSSSSSFGAGKVRSVASARACLVLLKAASVSGVQVSSLGLPLSISFSGASLAVMLGRNRW